MPKKQDMRQALLGGDRRSIGAAGKLVEDITATPGLLSALIELLGDDDPLIAMRAADATEKATRDKPEWIRPFKTELLETLATTEQQEVQWHIAQMLPRLELEEDELGAIVVRLQTLFNAADSRIVRACALEALVKLADIHGHLRRPASAAWSNARKSNIPSVSARARQLARRRPWLA